jgi:predicted exporter
MIYGDRGPFLTSSQQPAEYLLERLSHAAAARWVNGELPEGARLLLVGETRGASFDRDQLPVGAYDRHPLALWAEDAGSPEALAAVLRGHGVTHLVVDPAELERLHAAYRHFDASLAAGKVIGELLASSETVAAIGRVRVLRVTPGLDAGPR